MTISRESGFSLIEMLAVISIFGVLAAISIISWNSFTPGLLLDNASSALGDALELARVKSLTEHNQWFVILSYTSDAYITTQGRSFNFPANSYITVDDDGWLGTGSRKYNERTRFGGPEAEFSQTFDLDSGSATTQRRHNNMMEAPELFRGPLKLGRSITFMAPPDGSNLVRRVVFNYEDPLMFWDSSYNSPIKRAKRKAPPAKIYIRDQHYKPFDNSKDNLTHRRLILVLENAVRISH